MITKAPGPTADIVKLLQDTKTDVVVNFLPVGSEMATKWYVEQAIEAGCAFVNGIPVFIASSEYWGKALPGRGLPILGDDIKSQVGATILHRAARHALRGPRRAHRPHLSAQLRRQHRLPQHARARTPGEQEDLQDQRGHQHDPLRDSEHDNVHVGPSDHVPWLTDRKWAYIRMEGTTFGDVPLNVEVKLEVWDSPTPRA
jgi:myo-inositol-1-phosphate synthase